MGIVPPDLERTAISPDGRVVSTLRRTCGRAVSGLDKGVIMPECVLALLRLLFVLVALLALLAIVFLVVAGRGA